MIGDYYRSGSSNIYLLGQDVVDLGQGKLITGPFLDRLSGGVSSCEIKMMPHLLEDIRVDPKQLKIYINQRLLHTLSNNVILPGHRISASSLLTIVIIDRLNTVSMDSLFLDAVTRLHKNTAEKIEAKIGNQALLS